MQSLDLLLKNVSWDKEPEQQLAKLKPFDNLSNKEIEELVSGKYVKSTEAGIVIRYLGFSKLSNYVLELLAFLEDGNWPAAGHVSIFLTSIGQPLIPSIQKVFQKEYEELWHYWILVMVVKFWDRPTIELIKDDLLKLVKKADKEGAAIEALRILKDSLSETEFQKHYKHLLDRYKGDTYWLDELQTVL